MKNRLRDEKTINSISNVLINNKYGLAVSYLITILIVIYVYFTGGTHTVYANFLFIIIAYVSCSYKRSTSLIHAIISGLLVGPFMPLSVNQGLMQPLNNWLIRLVLYFTISFVISYFSEVAYREYKEILRKNKELFAAQHLTIYSLAKIAETRDSDTGEHIDSIVFSTKLLLTKLSKKKDFNQYLNEDDIDIIAQSSALHDIGKVAIKDSILLKPSKLTIKEFDIMKTHTTIGANTLKITYDKYPCNKYIKMGIDISLSHHEKWDGTGYPKGLKGDEIPFAARVVAIVDVYDSLRSKRAYKEAYSHETSLKILKEGYNSHFDGRILDVFIYNVNEFKDMYN
ncbi:hypothetical protein CI105_08510 [Candidatus Izimaplasma bacterium ZiA1]|uniref:HD-GYP domain-containing protein n=1 Tax=Candidatus Izimoplasma sp. ZiA1 TaxID=2024899 RepID=UPI000BAA4EB2|nr:hypothetical protein CI105_08510 [Candidatus Izimaplasma bacterium ZiA1]